MNLVLEPTRVTGVNIQAECIMSTSSSFAWVATLQVSMYSPCVAMLTQSSLPRSLYINTLVAILILWCNKIMETWFHACKTEHSLRLGTKGRTENGELTAIKDMEVLLCLWRLRSSDPMFLAETARWEETLKRKRKFMQLLYCRDMQLNELWLVWLRLRIHSVPCTIN